MSWMHLVTILGFSIVVAVMFSDWFKRSHWFDKGCVILAGLIWIISSFLV